MAHEKNYHSTKLEFLVLKWVVTEHFKEYLPYQPILVRTDNNPLNYIMTTPNLDATGHQWVEALMRFNFQLEYWKGWDNTVADMLSQITTPLSPEVMWSILNGVSLGAAHRVEGHDPAVVEGSYDLEKRNMCHHRSGVGWDACGRLGKNTKRGLSTKCCVGLAASLKENGPEDTLGRTCF